MAAALDQHARTYGSVPDTSETLERILGSVPVDPWGMPYAYLAIGQKYRIVSLGADRRLGGEGEDRDFGAE
jgi:general secretion pathway protein G